MVTSREGSDLRQPLHGVHAINSLHPLGHSLSTRKKTVFKHRIGRQNKLSGADDTGIGEVPCPMPKPPHSVQLEIIRDLFRQDLFRNFGLPPLIDGSGVIKECPILFQPLIIVGATLRQPEVQGEKTIPVPSLDMIPDRAPAVIFKDA